jgi:hypothetical protein
MRKTGITILASLLLTVAAYLWLRSPRLTVQNVLREATKNAKQGRGEDRARVFVAIVARQTQQGFTSDALETIEQYGHRTNAYETAEFATALAANGDVQNAKKLVEAEPEPDARAAGMSAIAIAQASRGDVAGARATAQTLSDRKPVEAAICRFQIRSGDIDGALATVESFPAGDGANMLLVLAESPELKDQEKKNLFKLARRIQGRSKNADKKYLKQWADYCLAGAFCCTDDVEQPPRAKERPSASACAGVKMVDWRSMPELIPLEDYTAGDMAGAERYLLDHPESMAVAAGLAIEEAARRGDIVNALRLANLVDRTNPADPLHWRPLFARALAAAWTKKDKTQTVMRWARKRPSPDEIAMALLGVADTLAGPTQLSPSNPKP